MAAEASLDLEGMSVRELVALRDAAEAKRQEKLEGAKATLLADFRNKAAELGMSLEALLSSPRTGQQGRKPRSDIGEKRAPKFRNPETGDTWSGRGREPGWLKGKNRQDFAVKE